MRYELDYVWREKLDFGEMATSLAKLPLLSPESKWGRLFGQYWHRAQLLLQDDTDGSLRLESIRAIAKETGGLHGLVTALCALQGRDPQIAHDYASNVVESSAWVYQASFRDKPAEMLIAHVPYRETPMYRGLEQVAMKLDQWRASGKASALDRSLLLAEGALTEGVWQLQDYAREPDGNLLLPVPGYSSTDRVPAWQAA